MKAVDVNSNVPRSRPAKCILTTELNVVSAEFTLRAEGRRRSHRSVTPGRRITIELIKANRSSGGSARLNTNSICEINKNYLNTCGDSGAIGNDQYLWHQEDSFEFLRHPIIMIVIRLLESRTLSIAEIWSRNRCFLRTSETLYWIPSNILSNRIRRSFLKG
jgi:hypothetical protein